MWRERCSNENMYGGSECRKLGRPKLKWSDVIRKDMKEKQVKKKKHKTRESGDLKLDAPTPNREKAEEEQDSRYSWTRHGQTPSMQSKSLCTQQVSVEQRDINMAEQSGHCESVPTSQVSAVRGSIHGRYYCKPYKLYNLSS